MLESKTDPDLHHVLGWDMWPKGTETAIIIMETKNERRQAPSMDVIQQSR